MKKIKTWGVGILIVTIISIGFFHMLDLITPETTEKAEQWIKLAAYFWVFFGSMVYLKWLKLLKKFKWNKNTEKWDQVMEDPR